MTLAFGPVAGSLGDRFGKRWFIIVAAMFGVVGSCISGSAQNTTVVIGGNILTGLANAGCVRRPCTSGPELYEYPRLTQKWHTDNGNAFCPRGYTQQTKALDNGFWATPGQRGRDRGHHRRRRFRQVSHLAMVILPQRYFLRDDFGTGHSVLPPTPSRFTSSRGTTTRTHVESRLYWHPRLHWFSCIHHNWCHLGRDDICLGLAPGPRHAGCWLCRAWHLGKLVQLDL